MYKILHFADLHLDTSFAGIGFPSFEARKYRESLRDALVRIIDLALERNVEAITIGGDLYEQERFSRDTGEFLLNQFERIAPIKIFIAPGNHDPFVTESLYQFLNWPGNVTIFATQEFEPVELNSGITLWGMAHTSPSIRKNPLENLRLPQNSQNILLFHGSDISNVPPGQKVHGPFTPDDLIKTGANYSLVGHYHRSMVKTKGKTDYFYPGSPEPLGFNEEDSHTIGLLKIADKGMVLETVAINKYRFVTGDIEVSAATTREQVKTDLENWLKIHADTNTFTRARLVGELAQDIDLDIDILSEKFKEYCAFGILTDYTRSGFDLAGIKDESTVRGKFVRTMQARIEKAAESEKHQLECALIYGLMAFEGRDIVKF